MIAWVNESDVKWLFAAAEMTGGEDWMPKGSRYQTDMEHCNFIRFICLHQCTKLFYDSRVFLVKVSKFSKIGHKKISWIIVSIQPPWFFIYKSVVYFLDWHSLDLFEVQASLLDSMSSSQLKIKQEIEDLN